MVFLRLSSGSCSCFWVDSDSAASEPGSGSGVETASEVESESALSGVADAVDASVGARLESLDEGFTRDLGSQGTYPRRSFVFFQCPLLSLPQSRRRRRRRRRSLVLLVENEK